VLSGSNLRAFDPRDLDARAMMLRSREKQLKALTNVGGLSDGTTSPDDDHLVQIRMLAGARNGLNLDFSWAAA
jgi:hypothetical protein